MFSGVGTSAPLRSVVLILFLRDFDSLDEQNVEKNNQLAFDIAEKELGISPIMTGKDMASVGEPDKLSMVMYLTQFYEMFKDSLPSSGKGCAQHPPSPPPILCCCLAFLPFLLTTSFISSPKSKPALTVVTGQCQGKSLERCSVTFSFFTRVFPATLASQTLSHYLHIHKNHSYQKFLPSLYHLLIPFLSEPAFLEQSS